MGLDMYLYASRGFAPESTEAREVLSLAGLTLDRLQAIAAADSFEPAMYLSRWGHSNTQERERAESIEAAAGLLDFGTPESPAGSLRWDVERDLVVVEITCCYWRKANAVHNWFVQKCQDGIDECQVSEVHPEQLAQLRADCLAALSSMEAGDQTAAAERMTPTPGFFFGGTEIDESYAYDMQNTVDQIERVVKLATLPGVVEFSYHSSW